MSITVDGEDVTFGPDEIEVTRTPRSGWFVATEGGLTVALDLDITPELRRTGIARDTIRLLQQARKDAGLDITDRIHLAWHAEGETAEAIREHLAHIAEEVLATSHAESAEPPATAYAASDDQLGVHVWIAKAGAPVDEPPTVDATTRTRKAEARLL